jgi:23S rRNA pseudouridine1911/1915/1917 synthase
MGPMSSPPSDLPADPEADGPDSPAEVGDDTERREVKLPSAQHGLRLDKALVLLAPEFSRSWLQQLISRGHVQVDGQVQTTASRKLRAGQHLQVALVPTAESLAFRPEPMVLSLVHEDEHLLVIHKPAGLVVHPAPGNWSGTPGRRICRVRASCTGWTRTPAA